jgi:hypothetical protein
MKKGTFRICNVARIVTKYYLTFTEIVGLKNNGDFYPVDIK